MYFFFFFFNDTATTEIYTLSLHDALPICGKCDRRQDKPQSVAPPAFGQEPDSKHRGHEDSRLLGQRSEEHTSELQSRQYLVCRLLLEKKNNTHRYNLHPIRLQHNMSLCLT